MGSRFIRDESGMTMGLTIIMVVLIGVMGAGLLTFVTTDLNTVAEVNRGQRAFEMADAGVKAAKVQLTTEPNPASYTSTNDWSDSDGKRMLLDGNAVDVRIEPNTPATNNFKVTSTGSAPQDGSGARRKIEAIFKTSPVLSFNAPPVFFTQNNLQVEGSASMQTSAFALGNADIKGASSFENVVDKAFGKWAATSGAEPYPNANGSFPNDYNGTARGSGLVGVGARGQLKLDGPAAGNLAAGTRSFGGSYDIGGPSGGTCPSCKKVVPNYTASPLSPSQKIAFPFKVPTAGEDAALIDALRNRALRLEQQNPGTPYYYDSNPGDGIRSGTRGTDFTFNRPTPDWPVGSAFDTVVFFEFATTGPAKKVDWNIKKSGPNSVPCTDTTRKGVIVVNNGNFEISDNGSGFNGGVVVRGNPLDRGKFTAQGTPCMNGYANSSGKMEVRGNVTFEDIPDISSLPALTGGGGDGTSQLSWRELYQ